MTRRLRDDRDGLSFLYQILILVVVIAVALGAFVVLYVQNPPASTTPQTAESGDTVTLEYIGTFEDTGKVFDTSYAHVALDNVSYPKAVSFSWRDAWQPFSFKIGAGSAIKGFDQGVRGMAVGGVKRVVVSPEDGYGALDMSKVLERPLLQEVAARVVMNRTAFSSTYGLNPSNGLLVIDPFWRWNASVALSNDIVTVTNCPTIGQKLRPFYEWDAVVESIDDSANNGTGIITVHHLLTPDDAGNIGATDSTGAFIISSVDLVNGVYVANYNREVVGRTLVFDMTLVSIVRG